MRRRGEKRGGQTPSGAGLDSGQESDLGLLDSSRGGVSAVFDTAFDLYKRDALRFMFVAALVLIPMAMLLSVLESVWLRPLELRLESVDSEGDFGALFQFLLAVAVVGAPRSGFPGAISMLAFLFLSVPITLLVSGQLYRRRVVLSSVFVRGLVLLPKLAVAWFAGGLAFFVVVVVIGFASLLAFGVLLLAISQTGQNSVEGDVLMFVGVVLLPYVMGCMVWARSFALSAPLVVLEGARIGQIPERNRQLVTSANQRRVGFAVSLLPVLVWGFSGLMSVMLESVFSQFAVPSQVQFWVQGGTIALLNLIFQPYVAIFFVVLYVQGVCVREGTDIRLKALGAGLSAPTTPYFASQSLASGVKRTLLLIGMCGLGGVCGGRVEAQGTQRESATQVRQQLKQILANEEFQTVPTVRKNPLQRVSVWLQERWDRFWKWLRSLFSMVAAPASSPALQWLFIVLFLGLGGWLCWTILRQWVTRRKMAYKETPFAKDLAEALERFQSVEEWLEQGARLSESGAYREAYRAVFMAALMRLHERGLVTYDRFRPNGEYLRRVGVRQNRSAFEVLSPLVVTFDGLWYGGQSASLEEYRRAVVGVERLQSLLESE